MVPELLFGFRPDWLQIKKEVREVHNFEHKTENSKILMPPKDFSGMISWTLY